MVDRPRRRKGSCYGRGAATVLLVLVALLSVAGSTASAKKPKVWYLSVSPAHVAQGGNVAIKTTLHSRCRLTLRFRTYAFHYTMTNGAKLLTIPRNETTGRWRVRVDCGQTYATNAFTVRSTVLATRIPITVANVCSLNPALGQVHKKVFNGYPTAYWTDGSQLSMLAFSVDGNSSVDIAVIPNAQGGIAYFARCSWAKWLTVAQYEQAMAQQGVSNAQASSFSYLLQEQQASSIYQEDSDWFTPEPGWQECPTNPYDECDYESTDGS
jgi:hypothetical protein